jgi:hypothetical protein
MPKENKCMVREFLMKGKDQYQAWARLKKL